MGVAQALAQTAASANTYQMLQRPGADNVCAEPSDPRAVSAAIDPCVDRLVRSDVSQDLGILQDDSAPPATPEPPSSTDVKPFAVRAPNGGATSWAPMAVRTRAPGPPDQWQDPPGLTVLRLPPEASPANGADNDETPLSESAPLATTAQGLARARLRREKALKQRQLTSSEKAEAQVCRQLLLSPLECRQKLKQQKLTATAHRTGAATTSLQKSTR